MLAAGDEGTAASELTFALENDPLHPSAQRLLGELHLRRHEFEEAFLCLQSHADAFPDDEEGWSDLAELRLQTSQLEEAEAALTSAVGRAPDRVDLLQRRAEIRYRRGRYHGALMDAQAVLRREAGSAPARTILGEATKHLREMECRPPALAPLHGEAEAWPGQLGATIRDFKAAARRKDWAAVSTLVRETRERYPHTMLGPWLDGVSSIEFGDLGNAERLLREALAVSPRSHRPITNLVAVWSRQRGAADTGDQLLQMVDRDPAFAYPLPIAAGAYLEAGQPARAEAAIRRMFEVVPGSPVPFREVAKFLLQLDRASDAIATVNDGLARFPGNADLLVEQAHAYAALGDREAAIRAYEAALSARPDDQHSEAELARLLVTARKDAPSHGRALQIVRDLECDAPLDSDLLLAIGVVLLDSGNDPRRARGWLEAARDRAPESPQLRYQLALAYARTKDVAAARRELQAALQTGGNFDEEPDARRLLHDLGDAGP